MLRLRVYKFPAGDSRRDAETTVGALPAKERLGETSLIDRGASGPARYQVSKIELPL